MSEQPDYPGDIQMEKRIENIIRWNAMAMVLRANDNGSGVGGHIATYASAATFMEVMLNHFVRSRTKIIKAICLISKHMLLQVFILGLFWKDV
ncbi:MAG: hypothetical protein Ct9H300mP4_00340 [Gammaproteobacteria bacterium]|nr:MAG: hypothetical protein Ct9H300mP4_00340 [Gammaproteobacteria bacterium]